MPDKGMIGKIIENYRLELILGQGGMAAVYKATDLKLQRQVAIKIMHPHLASQSSFQQRFLQEARAAALLDHPNIVRVLSFNNTENNLFIVMELIIGGNLRQYVKRLHEESKFVDYQEAIEVVRQLADALDYAHRQGMVHRDLKPDNVILKPEPDGERLNYRPIVTDFGLAKLTSSGENAITDQQPIGTYPYMSPEQCLAEKIDSRSDIYALGVMLYELAVGRLPYNPKTIAEAARMHGRDPLTLPSAVQPNFPKALEDIIVKALAKDPDLRYQTARELVEALAALQNPVEKKARPIVIVKTTSSVEENIPTDLSTALARTPLPMEIDEDIPRVDDEEKRPEYDRLVFFSRDFPTFAFDLDKPIVTIGRAPNRQIVLQGNRASRNHVQVERKPNGKYYITDMKSTNGTWLNEEKLLADTPVIFTPGDTVRLGDYWMQLVQKPEPTAEELAAADEFITDAGIEADAPTPPPAPPKPDTHLFDDEIVTQHVEATPREKPRHTPPYLTAEQMGFDRLIFYSESAPTLTAKLDTDHLSIGRAKNRDVVLEGIEISRRHARVERLEDGAFYITDLESTNGIWVENERMPVNTPILLYPEQIVRIGGYWMEYEPKRELPPGAVLPVPSTTDTTEFQLDVNTTVVMPKPLALEMPAFSPPPLSMEIRASDRLIFFSEEHPIQIVKIDSEIIDIGRDDDQNVILSGKRVSRRHLRLEAKSDGHLYITDLNSTNGTWVGDTLLVPNTQVLWEPEEIVRIGHYWMKFERGSREFDIFPSADVKDSRGLVGKRIKNYRIDRFIGQNNMTGVYKATELPLERPVALKIMHPNLASQDALKQRFLQEARMLSRLDHPNIVHVLSYDNVDNELFMVMELITGNSLRLYANRLKEQNKQLDLAEIINLTVQIADGLHYAHQQGMIHRDMKPESIVLKTSAVIGPIVRYQPVLTDFTVAQQSATGEIFVTDKPDTDFPYMSPEQCLGERVDLRSDIYELGVILYEMLVGRPPYQPRSIAEAVRMHAREPLQPPSDLRNDIPDDLEKIVYKALEKNPNNRFQTAGDLSRALQRSSIAVASEGIGSARFASQIVDDQATAVMLRPLPATMPLPTRYPEIGERTDIDRLVIYSEEFPTRVLPMDKNVLTVGRDKEQDIVLPGDKVSRRHLRIERGLGNVYRVIDLGSKNGSFLGNYRLLNNVSEIWEKTDTIRIGNYWIRIEAAEDPDEKAALLKAREARQQSEFDTDGGSAAAPPPPPPPPPPAELEKIGVSVNGSVLRVVPGSSTTLPIEIINRSDLVDHFKVEVVGLPANWVTQPSDPLYLLPSKRDTTSVTFHPPLNTNSSAGGHAFEVRVSARAQNIVSPGLQGSLNIEPFYNFITDLEPERIRGSRRAELAITNTGNTFATYTIQARDREQAVQFEMEGRQYTLAPGQTERVTFRPVAKRRPYFGLAQTYPFEMTVSAVPQEQSPPQTQNGEVVVPPIISSWMIGGCLLLVILCVLVSVLGLLQINNNNNINATGTAVAVATFNSATATAAVEGDTDGDGLSDIREQAIGTDPNLPDTDGDGLTDGEEVQVWRTNPLNRDTDGDSLIDGQEIKLGTDPLNRDTDGDGIPDNMDEYPLQRSTPTPIPFPTIPGSAGDICPGSPSPSQITAGIAAIVTEGGVANRVRSGPGKSNEIVGYMPPTTRFIVIGGPECDSDDQIRWWQISWNGLEGWTAEGEGDEYYLAPADGGGSGTTSGRNVPPVVIANPPPMVTALNPDMMGVQLDWNLDDPGWRNVMTASRSLGVGWIKLQASWAVLEPSPGQLGGEFGKLRTHLAEARANGYKVLLSIAKAPAWARSSRSEDGPPDNPDDMARFVGMLLDEIGGDVHAIEIWNEPNLRREWNGTLPFTGEGYMSLFKPVYEAIRQRSASMIVISAGLAPTATTAVSVNDRDYLRQMYESGLGRYDVMVGIHPFGWANAPDARCCDTVAGQGWDDQPQFFFLDTIAAYRHIMLQFGHGRAKLWTTEFGWGTWEGFTGAPPEPWMINNTTAQQADYNLMAFQIGQALDYMGGMFLWNLNFANTHSVSNGVEVAAYSLLIVDSSQNVSARASFDAFVSRRQQMQ